MRAEVDAAIAALHASPYMLVLELAGGGTQALYWLHRVPGSSRTVLEATDRYSARSLASLLGSAPAHAASSETATRMADCAYRRALELAEQGDDAVLLGVGCTSALTTDRARRGTNRCAVAVRGVGVSRGSELEMEKGARDRAGEEELSSLLLLDCVLSACKLDVKLDLRLVGHERVLSSLFDPSRDA